VVVRLSSRRAVDRWLAGAHDTARLVAWLCSDEAEWVTGQTIAPDGGWSTRGSS